MKLSIKERHDQEKRGSVVTRRGKGGPAIVGRRAEARRGPVSLDGGLLAAERLLCLRRASLGVVLLPFGPCQAMSAPARAESPAGQGEVTEWPKVHDWKSCVPARVPRVRIPPSPQFLRFAQQLPRGPVRAASLGSASLQATNPSLSAVSSLRSATAAKPGSSGFASAPPRFRRRIPPSPQ